MFSTAKTGEEGKQERSDALAKEIRIILVGQSGSGLSATGNTILGKTTFLSKALSGKVTRKCSSSGCHRFGKNMLVIDTPGIDDSIGDVNNELSLKTQVSILGSPEIHAFIFVVGLCGSTEFNEKAFQNFINFWGEEALNYTIAVFTRLDDLQAEQLTLEEYISDNKTLFGDYLVKIKRRILAVNNKAKSNESFVTKLQDIIARMISENNEILYTNGMLKKYEQLLVKAQPKSSVNIPLLSLLESINATKEQLLNEILTTEESLEQAGLSNSDAATFASVYNSATQGKQLLVKDQPKRTVNIPLQSLLEYINATKELLNEPLTTEESLEQAGISDSEAVTRIYNAIQEKQIAMEAVLKFGNFLTGSTGSCGTE